MVSFRLYPSQYQNPFPSSIDVENHETNRVSRGTSYGQRSNDFPIGHPQPQTLSPRSPYQLLPVVLLLIFLPIPPLLSLLYLSAGHVILSRVHKSSSSIYHIPILSSIEAGATGGVILSLPIAFILYLLIFYNKKPVPEDFFEDDSVTTGWTTYVGYLACVLFFVGIGGIAGPLGVTCLSSGNSNSLLSTRAAAAAGFLGGVVLSVGGLLLGISTVWVWSFWTRRKI